MHALRTFVQAQMDERGWTQSDLVAASGITKQVVSSLVSDARPKLDRLPMDKTIDGLARAFHVDRNVVLAKIGEAMGLPVSEPVVIYDASRVPNSDLLRVLSERLSKAGEEHEDRSAPMNPAGESPASNDVRRRLDLTFPSEDLRVDLPANPSYEAAATKRRELPIERWAARKGTPGGGPDLTSGEGSQDPGSDEPA